MISKVPDDDDKIKFIMGHRQFDDVNNFTYDFTRNHFSIVEHPQCMLCVLCVVCRATLSTI